MKTQDEVITEAQQWLNKHHPTKGDGAWSREFIAEVAEGKHFGHMNRPKALFALAYAES